MAGTESKRVWTVAEAKARLSEVLRLAESEGPQHIGTRKTFVVVPAESWYRSQEPRRTWAGGWSRMSPEASTGTYPGDRQSDRRVPFTGEDTS